MSDTEQSVDQQEGQALDASDFEQLLNQEFKPKSETAKEAVQAAVGTLAEIALRETTVVSSPLTP